MKMAFAGSFQFSITNDAGEPIYSVSGDNLDVTMDIAKLMSSMEEIQAAIIKAAGGPDVPAPHV